MTPADDVRAYWTRMGHRDWDGLRELPAPDVVVEWTASNERFVGPDNVIGVNAEYPDGWSIHLRAVVVEGDRVASDVEVPMRDVGVFRVAAFARVQGQQIASSVEYWIGVGADEPPAWRAKYSQPANDDGLGDRSSSG